MRKEPGGQAARSHASQAILVLDDAELNAHQVRAVLRNEQREFYLAASVNEALAVLYDLHPDLVVVSLDLAGLPGTRVLDVLHERARGVPVIAVSRNRSIEGAVEAVRHGAVDYLGSPVHSAALVQAVDRALREARSNRELEHARQQARDRYGFTHMLTHSPKMLRVFDQVRSVASTDATVLIRGETGTGKELITRAIHERSKRCDRPFITVNCGAFTETLLESELFGHEKGSFTGAAGRRQGVFEMADGGTLFLDELGETSLSVQVNLLRVLEEMEFRRVGGHDPVRVDVRILAATNVELEDAVRKRRFREDLYYRLNVFPIHLPPLRDRREDIPLLMRHFLQDAGRDYELEPPIITSEALDAILAYRWPGNVRQLRALCERWVLTHSRTRLEREDLPPEMLADRSAAPDAQFTWDEQRPLAEVTDRVVHQVEHAYLQRVLKRCHGHLARSAEAAGITRRTLYSKMKQHGLEAGDFRRPRR